MKNQLTREDYIKQCDEDIYSIIILLSLEYSELEKLDNDLFPIEFEVWSETGITESHISNKNYSDNIPQEIVTEIGNYLKELLTFPSEKWSHSEFEKNPFWNTSRKKAKEFVRHLPGSNY